MSPSVAPVTKVIYLCDEVFVDSSSQKLHLLGLLNSIRIDEAAFPFRLERLCVFVQMTDDLGTFAGYVEIVNARTGELVYRTPAHEWMFSRRTQLVYANFRILNCLFPEPGSYLVEFYCGGTFVDDRVLRVRITGETNHE